MIRKLGKSVAMVVMLVGLLPACAGLTSSKNEAAVAKVKKVAIAGFSVVAPKSRDININMGQDLESSEQMYNTAMKSFARNMKWQVLPAESMKANAVYKKFYKDTMSGFQNKMPPGENREQFTPSGVMDADCLRILGRDGRSELAKALGVDAVITARVEVLLTGNTVMGIGSRYPQSRGSFSLYTVGASTPDWFEGNLEGKVSETSVGKTALFDEKLLHKLAVESARTAFGKIGKKKS